MANKVFWKGLILVLKLVKRYIERNQINLTKNLTETQMNCVTAVLNAVIECLNALPVDEPTD